MVVSGFFWLVLGPAGTVNQIVPLYLAPKGGVYNINLLSWFWGFIRGELGLGDLGYYVGFMYGRGTHLSPLVYYGAFAFFISKRFEDVGITGSENVGVMLNLTAFSVGFFEMIYNPLYGFFQNQPWIYAFSWNLMTLHLVWFLIGPVVLVYYSMSGIQDGVKWGYGLKFGRSMYLPCLICVTAIMWFVWIFYPFPVQPLQVQTTAGVWVSNRLFPQGLYNVDIDPADNILAGALYYVDDNLLHLVGLVTKALTCLLTYHLVRPSR